MHLTVSENELEAVQSIQFFAKSQRTQLAPDKTVI